MVQAPSHPLHHPRRALLHAYVLENPGASFREVARQTGTPAGTARHHLSVLKRAGLLLERAHGCTVRFFENTEHYAATAAWGRIVLLREDALRRLHGWIALQGDVCQKQAIAAMHALHGWSRSTTQHRLARLAEGGLVAVRGQGRHRFYAALGREAGGGEGPGLAAAAGPACISVPSASS